MKGLALHLGNPFTALHATTVIAPHEGVTSKRTWLLMPPRKWKEATSGRAADCDEDVRLPTGVSLEQYTVLHAVVL